MKVKLTLDITLDAKEGEEEKTESFTMEGNASKDFPFAKLDKVALSLLHIIKYGALPDGFEPVPEIDPDFNPYAGRE